MAKKPRARRVGSISASANQRTPTKAEWIAELQELYRPLKKSVTVRLDADVLAWFKKPGRGYQTRINQVLRKVMMEERGKRR